MANDRSEKDQTDRLKQLIVRLAERLSPRQVKIMEVCGTHTVTAHVSGLHSVLPDNVELISGPGCPVCVTPAGMIDQAAELALAQNVHVMTYGDMIRTPGVKTSLEQAKGQGAKVSTIYSADSAVAAAVDEPDRAVVFLGIGFETTAPATAFALQRARKQGLRNFMVLSAHKRIIPAMELLCADGELAIDGFIAPGHVSVIIGAAAYEQVTGSCAVPCVVAGFDGVQMLMAVARILAQLVASEALVQNVYSTRVTDEGNVQAQGLIDEVFLPGPSRWRGLGQIERSGLDVREEFAEHDASRRFDLAAPEDKEPAGCLCARILKGLATPVECPLFAERCKPTSPVGACMVSREGACSSFYKHRRQHG